MQETYAVLEFPCRTDIQHTSIKDFERKVQESTAAQEQGIRAFIQALEERGLHAPELQLRIVPEVNDLRQNAKDALPAVPERDFDLH